MTKKVHAVLFSSLPLDLSSTTGILFPHNLGYDSRNESEYQDAAVSAISAVQYLFIFLDTTFQISNTLHDRLIIPLLELF